MFLHQVWLHILVLTCRRDYQIFPLSKEKGWSFNLKYESKDNSDDCNDDTFCHGSSRMKLKPNKPKISKAGGAIVSSNNAHIWAPVSFLSAFSHTGIWNSILVQKKNTHRVNNLRNMKASTATQVGNWFFFSLLQASEFFSFTTASFNMNRTQQANQE